MSNFQRIPPDPEGHSPEAVWIRQFKKFFVKNWIRSITGAKMTPDPDGGFHLVIPAQKPQQYTPPAQSSLSIRGEYDPTQVYNTSDIVIISMGSNSGTYFVTSATPITGIAPYTGAPNWAQFPLGQLGAYM